MMSDNQKKINQDLQQPATLQFVINLAQALETRIDYNFNSVIQMSMLVEFLYETLEKQGINIPIDTEFQEFQEKRMKEIQEKFSETLTETAENLSENILTSNINLEDD